MEHLQAINSLFKDRLYKIPDYQRGYAWEERHCQDLWDDIEFLDIEQQHYTGTLVVREIHSVQISDDNGEELTEYNIVDGQQRLTTISILMIEMIRQFELLGEEKKAESLRSRYIATKKDGEILPKLELNGDTKDFYKTRIIATEDNISIMPKIYSERRLYEAKEFFKEKFEEKKKEEGESFPGWLDEMRKKIVSKMMLTVYLVPNESAEGIIFEVMNNRGKPLTEMEKVKNYLLFVCARLNRCGGQKLAEEINKAWKDIYETLMDNDAFNSEDSLLRYSWIVTQDYRTSEWNGCNSVKKAFDLKSYEGNNEALRDDIRSYVKLLRESCKAYCDIIAPGKDKAYNSFANSNLRNDIVEYSHKLLRMHTTATFIPLLISLRLRYCTAENYLEILRICEIYAFRVFIMMEKRANAGQSAMYRCANEYFHKRRDFSSITTDLLGWIKHFCNRETFEEYIDDISDWYNWKGIKYLLFEYEMHLANRAYVHLKWKDFQKKDKKDTIEHILPQTPNKRYWTSRWPKHDREKVTHDIGNLVVTLDNGSYGNKGFDEKKGSPGSGKCYADSSLFSERKLYDFEDWTRTEFDIRRREISDWMKERWHIDDYVVADAMGTDDFDEDELESTG